MMKAAKIFLFFLCFIILVFNVSGLQVNADEIYINETFAYVDAYSNHGWTYAESDACCPDTPYDDGTGVGFGGTTDCGCSWNYLRQDTGLFTNSSINVDKIFAWDLYTNNTIGVIEVRMGDTYGNNDLVFSLYEGGNGNYTVEIGGAAGRECFFELAVKTNQTPYEVIVELSPFDRIMDVYVDDTMYCNGLNAPADADLSKLQILSQYTSGLAAFFDNFLIVNGTISPAGGDCAEPIIFCDDFNYNNSLTNEKDWIVFDRNNDLNSDFTPTSNTVFWNETNPSAIGHEIDRFTVDYVTGDGITTTQSLFAPSFSNEFDLILNNDSWIDLHFKTFDLDGRFCWDINFHRDDEEGAVNVLFYNQNDSWKTLDGTITPDDEHTIKIVSKFNHENKSYPFNTSYDGNKVDIYSDNTILSYQEHTYFNDDCENIFYATFTKDDDNHGNLTNVSIDDYYMYIGLDKYVNTLDIDAIPLYEEDDAQTFEGNGTGDLSEAIDDVWSQMGLISTASKYTLSLLLLFIVTIVIVGLCVRGQVENVVPIVLIVDIVFMIFLVYIKLLPIWIPIVLGLIGSGMGLLFVKYHAS